MLRRKFLQLCNSVGLGLATPIDIDALLRADEVEKTETAGHLGPYYIVFNASGGWDTTYLMDPKGVDGINRLYQRDDIQSVGAHHFAPTSKNIKKGMSNEDFFQRYGNEILTFNGLDLSVNNHTPCSRYMATGKLDSTNYPTFPALVAACHGAEAPLAFLTFGNYSATGNLVPMSRVPYLHSLNLLARADFVEGNSRAPYHDSFVSEKIENALQAQFDAKVSSVQLPRVERSQSMLYSAQVNSKALQQVLPYIPKESSKERLAQQADIALASFKAGVCISANLSIGQFDSHNNNDVDQMKLIPELLAGIDYVLRKAEDLKIREKLIVIMQSEMGRTPAYNNGNGKDHWSINSMMFLGAGIAGNRVVGRTDDKQMLTALDPTTLELKEKTGIRVRPEHIHEALRRLAGVWDHPFSRRFPLSIPSSEMLEKLWVG